MWSVLVSNGYKQTLNLAWIRKNGYPGLLVYPGCKTTEGRLYPHRKEF